MLNHLFYRKPNDPTDFLSMWNCGDPDEWVSVPFVMTPSADSGAALFVAHRNGEGDLIITHTISPDRASVTRAD